jgi:hypothetical protein
MPSTLVRPLGALLTLLAALGAAAQPADWAPNETQVSAEPTLIDIEFSQSRGMLTWVDEVGGLWIANVNRDTGLFEPADGRGLLVDTNVAALGSAVWAFNGPEWVMAARGDQLTYTRYLPDQPKAAKSARVAVAQQARDGSWRATLVSPNEPRYIPFGSENPRDRSPRITYLDPEGNHYWRGTGRFDKEHRIDGAVTPFTPIRQVRGAPGVVVFPAPVDGVQQLFRYRLDTQALEQLTFDAGSKKAPWMWQAPEYGNEFVMSAIVDNTLRIFRERPQADGSKKWESVLQWDPPEGLILLSPEPMTYDGRSYMFMGMGKAVGLLVYSVEIWIAGIDPAAPVFRRITEDSPPRVRSDPEVFITRDGPRIYFNRYQLTDDPEPVPCRTRACSEGVWMADPGLTAAR